MECTLEILSFFFCCLSYSQVWATIPQSCNTQTAYTSPFVQAFTSQEATISGCSAQVDETSREVHVINLKSTEEDLLHTNQVMTLNIGPRSLHMRTTLVVLNSVHPVTWKLVTQHDVGPLLFQFVIPTNSSVVKPTNIVVPTISITEMPSEDDALLAWVTSTYSKVWTFSTIESANVINLQVGQDPNAPEECTLTPNYQQSHISASQVEPVRIGFCIPDISRATQEVHLIWLLSPSSRRSSVVVELKEVSRNAASKRRVVLILQADTPVVWNIVSSDQIRHLTIMSPHQVNTEGITSGPFELQKENIPSTGDNLLTWARDRYSAVVSFTEAVLANKFDITVGKANISRHTHPLSPDQTGSTSIDWPDDSPHVVVECLKNSIRALVPTVVAEYYNLSPEDITLEDRDCTSVEYMTLGFMLDTQLNACGTTSEQRMNKMIYRNRVLFFNGSPEGSGAGMEGSGDDMPLGDVDVDDEDSSMPFYASSIECEYLHGPTNTKPGMTDNHVTLHMDMYQTPLFQDKVVDFPAPLQDHTRLYFQVGVSGGQRRHEVVINQCWIQVADEIVHSLIDFSCPVDQTVIFHELNPNYVSLDPQEDGDLKRFSFEVHWTRETFGLHTFVSCKLSLCSKDYNTADEEKGIPVCSTLEALQQACSGIPGVRVGQQLPRTKQDTEMVPC
eukprot:XP_011682803.1 PREDICTED: transforming growth factor beta receptor type 3 [Strongylocentrotus purpuratus]